MAAAPRTATTPAKVQTGTDDAVDALLRLNPSGVRGTKLWRLAPRRILVGIDGTPSSANALSWARGIAQVYRSDVTLVVVLPPAPMYADYARWTGATGSKKSFQDADEQKARRLLEQARARLGVETTAGLVARGAPAHEIVKAARRTGADMIILGSHGHGRAARIMLGSVAEGVKNRATVPVLIARSRFSPGPVLAAVDGSEGSRVAAAFAIDLGRAWKRVAILHHVHEMPWLGWPEDGRSEFEDIIKKFGLPPAPEGVRYVLSFGHPAELIVATIKKERPALVVIGARGLGPLKGALLGSVSNRVVHASTASVLVVRVPTQRK
jgi:nucleotide-binding universal stress UspA family protein